MLSFRSMLKLSMILTIPSLVLAQEPRLVEVRPLSEIASYPLRSAPATVISLNQPQISAEISARLESLPVKVGDRVAAGEILAQLDCRETSLSRRSAEAQQQVAAAHLDLARARLNRAEPLVVNQLLSQDDLDSRRTELQAAEAQAQDTQARLELARLQESRCTIRAPFDALVLERSAQSGQWLSPGTPVISLLDMSRIEISAQVFVADAQFIDAETDLALEVNGQNFAVRLRTLLDAIDPTTRNREARFEFMTQASLIGAAGKVSWRDPRPHVPPQLLLERDGALGIFLLRQNRASFLSLPDAQPGRNNPIDLPLDTLVVVEGHLGLRDGDPAIAEPR